MLNYIWAVMIILSIIVSIFTGKIHILSDSIIKGTESAVTLLISITGITCFWSGIMEIAEKSCLTDNVAKIFHPLLSKLFKNASRNTKAMNYICMNISANLMGLGNAATPLGLNAMKELKNMNHDSNKASDDMVIFVVLNTASLQLIPTTLCAYRSNYGSTNPFEILPAVWVTSMLALTTGLIIAKLFMGKGCK